jgi:NAD(P)-dependent dehydrogenase (short-subunit alcohol dehydrogenase family)
LHKVGKNSTLIPESLKLNPKRKMTSFLKEQFSLDGKIAVFTGGTGVLGSVMCKALAQAGATVVVIGRRENVAQAIAKEIIDQGGKAIGLSLDVLNETETKKINELVLNQFGAIDILVNAAGGNIAGATIPPDKNFFDLSIDDFRNVVELNLTGTVISSKIFGESMAKRKSGAIINISSMTATRPLTRVVGYSAAKSAVSNFTNWLAVEMASKFGEGVRVNAIAPGFFLTEQNRNLLTNADGTLTARGKAIIDHTPFKRFGEPQELSGTLIWLCSDASKFVNGTVVTVDGGFSAYAGV